MDKKCRRKESKESEDEKINIVTVTTSSVSQSSNFHKGKHKNYRKNKNMCANSGFHSRKHSYHSDAFNSKSSQKYSYMGNPGKKYSHTQTDAKNTLYQYHQSQRSSGKHQTNTRSGSRLNQHEQLPHTHTSSEESSGSVLEIPGFYYDASKKRYFKILPSSGNVNVVTKETLKKEKAEQQRQKDLEALHTGTAIQSNIATVCSASSFGRKKKDKTSFSSVLLDSYQRGEIDSTKLKRIVVHNTAASLKHVGQSIVFAEPWGLYEKLEHMHQMETSQEHDKLLCLWSVKGSMIQRLQLVTLQETPRTRPGHLSVEFDPSGTTVLQSWNKIMHMCWADFPQFPDKKYVLYTTMCHTSQAYSLAFIRNMDPACGEKICFFDFNLGTQATWTCAWNQNKQQFSVGTEKGCMVIDVNTRRLWQFKTHDSDVLAQTFSQQDGGNLMYTGTRRGQILVHDLRSKSTFPQMLINHLSSLTCLRLSPDEHYIYASDFSGKIRKWDLRMRRAVIYYDGLFNQYSKLPFHIDETQSLLYAAGEDSYTKLWCLQTGKLLHSIPPPCQASRDTIPAIQFSTHWGGATGNQGLIMGMNDKFFLYGSGVQD